MKVNNAVVIEDRNTLMLLCGSQDENLKLMEKLIGFRVHTRGNELILDSARSEDQILFSGWIARLVEGIRQKREPSSDYIKAVFDSLKNGEVESRDRLEESMLSIPGGIRPVYPRNRSQQIYLEQIFKRDLVFGIGPAGTGKTYLAVAAGLLEVLSKKRRKIVLTRPVVETGENLGFLPGDLTQKISPYLRPLYDAMEILLPPEVLERMDAARMIEVAPLAYMRGRSLSHCFVILDEAQNTTREQMKMFLTRLGEDCRAVITGDITQIDLPGRRSSGLVEVSRILSGVEDIGFHYFGASDVVRNPLVQKIIRAYEKQEKKL